MTILYLIVARGGSKRVPGKNLRQINGIPLVGYKALAMKGATSCGMARHISTDSEEIARAANRYLAMSCIHRPAGLATDTATTEDVVRHAIKEIEKYPRLVCDAIMLMEPSSPFVRPSDYDKAVEIMEEKQAQFVFGEVIYLFRWDYLKKREDLFDNPQGFEYMVIPAGQAIDIDTLADLKHAEFLTANQLVDVSWTQ